MIVGLQSLPVLVERMAFIPHGHCYLWQPGLVWLHALSDGFIAAAYLAISLGLAYFARQRRDLPYPWLFQLFGAFIVACGLTHAMAIWTLWYPTYWVSGTLKALTAGVSIVAAIALFPVIPTALTLPSRRELAAMALDLEEQVRDRTRSLQQSQEGYKALLDSINGIVWELDIATFQVTFVSQKAALMLGYPVEYWCSQPDFWLSCLHPDDRHTVIATYRRMAITGEPQDLEYRMITADGRVVWLWDQSRVLLDGDRPVKLQGIMVDITDRKTTEAALALANTRLQNVAANIPGAVFRYLLRPDGSDAVLYMSPGCAELWEVPATEAEKDAAILWQMVHPDDHAQMLHSVQRSAQTLQSWSNAWRIITPSGREKWLEASGKPERQTTGDVIWDTVILDVSDRKAAELALRHSESRLQLALEASGEGLWDWNIATGEVYLNARYQQMLGYEPGDLQLTVEQWQALIHPDDRPWVLELLNHHFADPSVYFGFDYRVRCHSGVWKWIANYGKVVAYDPQGQPLRMLGVHIDISDRKATETALKIQRDFNQLIAEITSRFVNLCPQEFDLEIERTLRLISETTHLDTSYLLMLNPDGLTMSMTHEWSQSGLPRQQAIAQNIPLSAFPWSMERLQHRQIVYVPDVAEMTQVAPVDQASWQRFQLKAVISVPLVKRTGVVGLIGFASFTNPISWEAGTIRLLIVLGQTIANAQQQAQDEQQLAISEERLRLALAAANQGLYDLNIVTGEVIVTPEYALMLGYDPATFQETNLSWVERLHPDDRAATAAIYQAYIAGEIPDYKTEFRQRTCLGDYKWILSMGKVVEWNEAGQPVRMLGTHTDISDRKRIEAELRIQTELLQSTFDYLPVMIEVYSEQGDVLIVNRQLEKIIGWSKDEYQSINVLQECYPDRADYDRALHHISTADSTWQDFCTRLRDGRSLETSWAHIRLSDGRSIGIGQDISDRKRAEAARLQAEKLRLELNLLESILNSVLAGYWDRDFVNQTNYWSRGLKQMLGYAEHELSNSMATWQQLIFPDDLPKALACFQEHVQSHGTIPYYTEVRYRHKTGSTIWVICAGQVIRWDESGAPLRMVGCHVDITKLKQTEAQLQASEWSLREAQRIGKLGSWRFDLATECITWSDQVFRIFQRDLALGPPAAFEELQALIHPSDRDRHAATVQHTLATGEPYSLECCIARSNSAWGYVQANGEVIRDATGQIVQLTGTVLDITERKQIEAQLRQTSTQLAASNHELEAFAYSVSHDLRAPLRAIDGFSKALLEDYGSQFDEDAQYYFNRIRYNIQRMGALIDDLLNLSRVSRYDMQLKPVNLSQLAQEQLAELRHSDRDRVVETIITPDVMVFADPTLMGVVINNLLANAWKFTSHHVSARIEFGIIKQYEEIVYFVRDDGAGFDMTYAAKLFGVFQRLHNTDEFPGTGIGLATVQRAIHRHGGRVWAEATVEQGATIFFTIPNPTVSNRV